MTKKKTRNVFNLNRYREYHDYDVKYLDFLRTHHPEAYAFLSDFVAAEYYGYAHHDNNQVWEGMSQEDRRRVWRECYHRNNDVHFARKNSMVRDAPEEGGDNHSPCFDGIQEGTSVNWKELEMIAGCDVTEDGELPYSLDSLIYGDDE